MDHFGRTVQEIQRSTQVIIQTQSLQKQGAVFLGIPYDKSYSILGGLHWRPKKLETNILVHYLMGFIHVFPSYLLGGKPRGVEGCDFEAWWGLMGRSDVPGGPGQLCKYENWGHYIVLRQHK